MLKPRYTVPASPSQQALTVPTISTVSQSKSSPRLSPRSDQGAIKYEEVPLVSMDGVGEDFSPQPRDGKEDTEITHKTFLQRFLKTIKILLPHIGLTIILLCYICAGAAVLQFIEQDADIKYRRDKLIAVSKIYTQIMNSTWDTCHDTRLPRNIWEEMFRKQLIALSSAHEYDERQPIASQFSLDEKDIESRWSFPAAVLYSLTILTTTGYDVITPRTDAGKLFSVFFGLIGIPLMFITAADIGKFLSDVFLRTWGKIAELHAYLTRKFRPKAAKAKNAQDDSTEKLPDALSMFDEPPPSHIELPVIAYFGLILSYCALGGVLYTRYETAPIWTFLHAFHFSFNTITTISLGNVIVRNAFYLIFIVIYIVVGLSVVTMCVDLASSHLKLLFSRIHYFGRKMRMRSAFATMSDDIREAMKLIAVVRRHKPGNKITLDDLRQAALDMQASDHKFSLTGRPFVPNAINILRYVDEDAASSRSGLSGSGLSMNLVARPSQTMEKDQLQNQADPALYM